MAVVGLLGFNITLYRRDTHALPRAIAFALLTLRLFAVLGLLVFFLGPEQRSEARILKPSRLAVLVDTSLSMGLSDGAHGQDGMRRIDAVIKLFQDSDLLQELNQQHELEVYRFGESSQPELMLTAEKVLPIESAAGSQRRGDPTESLSLARSFGGLGQVGVCLAVVLLLTTVVLKLRTGNAASWSMASGSLLLTIAVFLLALADLLVSQFSLPVSLGWRDAKSQETRQTAPPSDDRGVVTDWTRIDWPSELMPQGVATRLGAVVQELVDRNRGSALAGIVLISDGRNNQGPSPTRAVAAARDASIPVFVLGTGSNLPAQNVRISDLEAPGRVFPNDKFSLQAIIQSFGLQGTTVRVRLSSLDADQPGTLTTEDERSIQLPADGEPMRVKFELSHNQEGRRRYRVELDPPAADLDRSDNQQSTVVQVLQRKSRVLLIAGGPTRDYQFLRNQLFRDENVELDVWLQLARPGADQESDQLLFRFPETAAELDVYDCLIGFDPDWRLLSWEQCQLLEQWVSQKAGGLLLIAGPVFTPEWTRRPRGEPAMDLIRGLYPVSFYSQGTAMLKLGRFGGSEPFPLSFTRAGRNAKHLWLGSEDAADSIANWEAFAGVYGYYAVNEAKPGAEILARFSDESTAVNGELPIYLASHFYGAGRVLFQGSGEVWRLRTIDVEYFQNYYGNLIRWVSEGRLLRDSSRGVLLLDRNRCWVGDQVGVRAILRDAADQPLMQPQVNATVRRPNGISATVALVNVQDAARPGTFSGQVVTSQEGGYEISLPIPFSPDRQILRGQVQASIPDLEKVNPERDDVLLQEIADRTGGLYFYDLGDNAAASWLEPDSADPQEGPRQQSGSLTGTRGLSQKISVVDQETFLPGSPNEQFARKFSRWLFAWLVLVLCTEWILRRLHKLA